MRVPFSRYANAGRARMVRMLSSMPVDKPVGTWRLLEYLYGRVYVSTHDTWHTHHKARVAIDKAEKYGYIRCAPYTLPVSTPSHIVRRWPRKLYREKAWIVTDIGLQFLEDYIAYMRSHGIQVKREDMPYTMHASAGNYVVDRDFR